MSVVSRQWCGGDDSWMTFLVEYHYLTSDFIYHLRSVVEVPPIESISSLPTTPASCCCCCCRHCCKRGRCRRRTCLSCSHQLATHQHLAFHQSTKSGCVCRSSPPHHHHCCFGSDEVWKRQWTQGGTGR